MLEVAFGYYGSDDNLEVACGNYPIKETLHFVVVFGMFVIWLCTLVLGDFFFFFSFVFTQDTSE